ncbi:MAG: hypothetical protein H0W72_11905, partial [Planctomycetes bacterium]|nr:hypothetical protein [Planctomycetota bacterium]
GTRADDGSATDLTLIPYALWDNRSPDEDSVMTVMIPETAEACARPLDRGRLGAAELSCSYVNPNDTTDAVRDGRLGSGSGDQGIPRFTWWGHKGTQEWIAYTFNSPQTFWRSDVLWFDDSAAGGGCAMPRAFHLEWWDAPTERWQAVALDADYQRAGDRFATHHPSVVRFAPVTTTRIRLVVELAPERSCGILEWRLPEMVE